MAKHKGAAIDVAVKEAQPEADIWESVQVRRKARSGGGGGGGARATEIDLDDSPAPSAHPSPAPVATYADEGPSAGYDAAAVGGAHAAPAVVVEGYAVDVSQLQQSAKDYRQQGVVELNNILSGAVAQAKNGFAPGERKLLECAAASSCHANILHLFCCWLTFEYFGLVALFLRFHLRICRARNLARKSRFRSVWTLPYYTLIPIRK